MSVGYFFLFLLHELTWVLTPLTPFLFLQSLFSASNSHRFHFNLGPNTLIISPLLCHVSQVLCPISLLNVGCKLTKITNPSITHSPASRNPSFGALLQMNIQEPILRHSASKIVRQRDLTGAPGQAKAERAKVLHIPDTCLSLLTSQWLHRALTMKALCQITENDSRLRYTGPEEPTVILQKSLLLGNNWLELTVVCERKNMYPFMSLLYTAQHITLCMWKWKPFFFPNGYYLIW